MKTLHLGITWETNIPVKRQHLTSRTLPVGMVTDGDSFLCWGDDSVYGSGEGKHDNTWHVIVNDYQGGREGVERERERLLRFLWVGERLIDYAVITDQEDWAEDQQLWTLEGVLGRG